MAKALSTTKKILSNNLFPVVGIGASAGGLEAFKRFIRAIPEDPGMAFILVQHLHPEHSSALPGILQRETTIHVQEVTDNVKVQPNHVYIIPTNKILVANDGILQLSPRPKNEKNMPIDIFFSSLAEVHQSHAIGIILSGTGTDGTIGLEKIKNNGGITFAQELNSAEYEDMPANAIRQDVIDFVLLPEEMPGQLLYAERAFRIAGDEGGKSGAQKMQENIFRQILTLIRVRTGADFTYYKQTTIHRRILRRQAILKLENISDYLDYLRENKSEQDLLFQDLLIPVTGFFRDHKVFDHVCGMIFPELIKGKNSINPLRIWVAGCATGEEAYSLGICLYEYLADKISSIKIQIFATDISERSVTKARAGIYGNRQLEGVSASRLQQFFTKTDGSYQIKKSIRDLCVFATHNFLKDPPFAKVDLISCRNVLIYMEPFLQKKAFTTFHYALNEKGYLLLGKSETTGNSSDLFATESQKDKLYTRKSVAGKFMNITSSRREEALKDKDYGLRSMERKRDDYQKNADEILLTKYTPPGVILNEQFDIVQFRGSTGPYLEPSPGKASLNVLKMAREGLSFELRNALQKVKSSGKLFIKEGIMIDNIKKLVTIEIIPLPETIDPHFLVLFKENAASDENPGAPKKGGGGRVVNHENSRIKSLEKDLLQIREDMRGITEDQEAANEELQSANEELLSSSEELQSLNEELETSKEELQSTNEELITLNQEMFDRNEQLNQAMLYAEAVVTTVHEPLLVLNNNFRIRSANNAFYRIFLLSEKETLGKMLFDLQDHSWEIPGLRERLLKLQHQKDTTQEWEVTHTFPVIGEKVIRVNAQSMFGESDNQLILLAFDDITLRKQAEKIQQLQSMKFILEAIPQITFSASPAGEFSYFNNFFVQYSGMSLAMALKEGWFPVMNTEQEPKVFKAWQHSLKTLEDFVAEFQLKRKSDGMYRWHLCRASVLINDRGEATSWVGSATDIDEQKSIEKAKDEFIGIASHELRTPLTSAKAYVQLIEHNMRGKNNDDIIFAKKANASLQRLEHLVTELLDVSKIQHGKLGLNLSMFNFDAMVAETVEGVQLATNDHKIILTGEIKREIEGDEDRLKQVIINLLTNAIKYSPAEDKVFVNVSLEEDAIMISVKDNGIGISKKNINRIFERYFRGETKATPQKGLGIGLSISKEIVRRHKGKIWAESEQGKGATFYVTIPV